MRIKRLAGIVFCTVLLAIVAFIVIAFWVGSWLVAPHRSAREAAPVDLPVLEISLESSSGSVLSGWFIDSDQGCGTVVLMHGVRADKRALVSRARFLVEAGYAIFLFDFQAHGESSGETITFGYLEQMDAAAAMRFVSRQRPNRPIAVIGLSMGGAAAVLNGRALGADAVVLESVYSTLKKAVINRVRLHAGNLGLLTEFLVSAILIQLELRLDVGAERLRPVDQIATLEAPVFVIAGSKDRHTTLGDSRQLFELASEPKRFWLVEGAGHVDFYRHDPQSYAKNVLEFLNDHMRCG
jgi:fermentation-respiration switch protein FrsA (DUF1100 family)